MKRALCLLLGLFALPAACGVDDFEPVVARPPSGDAGADGGGALTPALACTDTDDAIYGDPGPLPDEKGAILKCATGGELTKEQIQARLTAIGSSAVVSSGARTFKVLYRTERGNAQPGYSSAIVYVPTEPRAATLPIVVGGRGTRGEAPACAVTKADVMADGEQDYARLVLTMVGNGFAMIVPDLAGYANYGAPGNPPSAYAQAADVGKSTLDGSRALKKLFPALDDKTVLVGHSQGGHSVLAALSLAETYGAQGPVAGVAVYAPLWLSQRSWGALLDKNTADALGYTLQAQPFVNTVSLWYHYSQAELLDGQGEGAKLFVADKQAAMKQFFDSVCVSGPYDILLSQGTNYLADLFDPAIVSSVGFKAAFGGDCAGDPICQKWIERYTADRPHLAGAAASTPIFMAYGMKDTTIPPNRMRCALDRLQGDGVNLTVCVEPEATHGSIIDLRGQHVAQWVANLTIPGSVGDLPACPAGAEAIQAVNCATPPPND